MCNTSPIDNHPLLIRIFCATIIIRKFAPQVFQCSPLTSTADRNSFRHLTRPFKRSGCSSYQLLPSPSPFRLHSSSPLFSRQAEQRAEQRPQLRVRHPYLSSHPLNRRCGKRSSRISSASHPHLIRFSSASSHPPLSRFSSVSHPYILSP